MESFGFDHLHLRGADANATAGFLVDNFGARNIETMVVRGRIRVVVAIGALTMFIEDAGNDLPTVPEPPFRGIEHIGLVVDALDDAMIRLRDRGVHVLRPIEQVKPGVRVAFVLGPDNLLIELLERRGHPGAA